MDKHEQKEIIFFEWFIIFYNGCMQYLYYMGSIWQACDALDVRKILHVTIMHKDKIQLQN